jgi:hypothetical protein
VPEAIRNVLYAIDLPEVTTSSTVLALNSGENFLGSLRCTWPPFKGILASSLVSATAELLQEPLWEHNERDAFTRMLDEQITARGPAHLLDIRDFEHQRGANG